MLTGESAQILEELSRRISVQIKAGYARLENEMKTSLEKHSQLLQLCILQEIKKSENKSVNSAPSLQDANTDLSEKYTNLTPLEYFTRKQQILVKKNEGTNNGKPTQISNKNPGYTKNNSMTIAEYFRSKQKELMLKGEFTDVKEEVVKEDMVEIKQDVKGKYLKLKDFAGLEADLEADLDSLSSVINGGASIHVEEKRPQLILKRCDEAGKSTLMTINETQRRRKKADEFKCEPCGYTTGVRSRLTRHIREIHEKLQSGNNLDKKSFESDDKEIDSSENVEKDDWLV